MKGMTVVITGPSGVGKTTLASELTKRIPNTTRLVTTTTRTPRSGELDGQDYHFITRAEFISRSANNEFLEWEETYGNYYGSSRIELQRLLEIRPVVFVVVDTRGAISVRQKITNTITIFIMPESTELVAERVNHRKGGTETERQARLRGIQEKIEQAHRFDYQVINKDGDLAFATTTILTIINDRYPHISLV